LFERPGSGEKTLLVHVSLGQPPCAEARREFAELAASAGAQILDELDAVRARPDPRYFVGGGKVDEIAAAVAALGVDIVMFDHALSPSQERNLEKRLQCRVLDRAGLILDIFAQRARSFEGKLQVELAQLQHLSTRLVRGWTHLERQKGGIGLRGPGETQLETDRRLLAQRIKQIRRRLDNVRRQREQGRAARRKAEVPTVALVGYTNAGKSTLFNRLAGAGVYAADQLFATLDPTLRRLVLDDGQALVLADTVGFVSDLPHELVAAFHATLQETRDADLLLHVIDAADEQRDEHSADVEGVLDEIGAGEVPTLRIYNKIDRCAAVAHVEHDESGAARAIWLSAVSGGGLELLREALGDAFRRSRVQGCLQLGPQQGRLRAALYAEDAVLGEEPVEDGGTVLEICMDRIAWQQIAKREGLSGDTLCVSATVITAGSAVESDEVSATSTAQLAAGAVRP